MSPTWPVDLELMLKNAEAALHDFADLNPIKGHIGKLGTELERDRSLVTAGAVEGRTAALESELKQAKSVLQALEG